MEARMRLQGLEIPVVDMERAFAFYTEVLGFPVINRRGNDSAMLFLGNVHDGMVTLRRQDRPPGVGTRFLLESDESPDDVRARLERAGVVVDGPNRNLGVGVAVYFSDTEGNSLGIMRASGVRRLRELQALSFSEMASVFDDVEERTRTLLSGVSEDLARRTSAPGEWSIVDLVGHVTDTLETCPEIIGALSEGRQAPRGGLLERTYPAPSLHAANERLWQAFTAARLVFRALPERPNLDATLGHGVFGPLTCHGWTALMLFHTGMHLDEIAAIKQAP
jgi:catechol 2,3-dioxygenase